MEYDVVVTTYNTLAQEIPGRHQSAKAKERNPERGGVLYRCTWHRIVLDEGHCIKNSKTVTARACYAVRAHRRWVLSGTPVQNSVKDLYSLFKFFRLKPYDSEQKFKELASNMDSLKAKLFTVMKRRMKDTKIDGKLLLNLPKRTIEDVYCEFSKAERDLYERQSNLATNTLSGCGHDGKIDQFTNVLSMLMKLRLLCNHPYLALKHSNTASNASQIAAQYRLPEHVVIAAIEADALEVRTCQQCLKDSEELYLVVCGHVYCMGCLDGMNTCCICSRQLAGPEGEIDTWRLSDVCTVFTKIRKEGTEDDLGFGPERPSAKIKYLYNRLREEAKADPPRKTVVFSQWVCTLDIVAPRLKENSFVVFQIDGRMPMSVRTREIERFRDHRGFAVMLMSLHTGSLGLNLTFASNVIIMDSWWNPAVEAQAIDRVHRIGQTQPVTVSKLIIKGSVEAKVIDIQQRKLKQIHEAYSGHKLSATLSKFSVDELRSLFSAESGDK
eukprot:c19869_g1_i3.p1 GENE.c19869_g1_i3~~c19869_g1_i3.p1  ORF type:complete len:497 (+),score=125.92 c19869_g1_i3:435-1925(+)